MTKTNPYKPPETEFLREKDRWGEKIDHDNEADWVLFWVIFLFIVLFFFYGILFNYLVDLYRYLLYNET